VPAFSLTSDTCDVTRLVMSHNWLFVIHRRVLYGRRVYDHFTHPEGSIRVVPSCLRTDRGREGGGGAQAAAYIVN